MSVGYYAVDQREMMYGMHNKQFMLSLQPIINIETESFETLEVFIRWRHPLLGMLPPSFFMPRIFDAGLSEKMTDYILKQAVTTYNLFASQGNNVGVNVNINVDELHKENTLSSLESALKMVDDPENICLEITPRFLLDYFKNNQNEEFAPDLPPSPMEQRYLESLQPTFKAFEKTGATLALDTYDYILGGIDRAKILKLHAIKISPKCLQNLAYLRTAIQKAKTAGIALVATGVENMTQMQAVIAAKMNYAQGMILSPPVYEHSLDMWNKENLMHAKNITKDMASVTNNLAQTQQDLQKASPSMPQPIHASEKPQQPMANPMKKSFAHRPIKKNFLKNTQKK